MQEAEAHIVHSPSAAGSLRHALRDRRRVLCTDDAPHLGPLHDGRARADFFRKLWNDAAFEQDWLPDDSYAVWGEIARDLEALAAKKLIIWTSKSGADFVFLRMAAHFLDTYQGEICQVEVPLLHEIAAVAMYPADQLLPLRETAKRIDGPSRKTLVEQFRMIAARPEPLRLTGTDGQLGFYDVDYYDSAILDHAGPDWLRASYVVGMVMGHADGLNPVGDLLITARLRHLIGVGKIETLGDASASIREFQVRKVVGA